MADPEFMTGAKMTMKIGFVDLVGNMGAATEALNERAVQVMQRLSDKLTGRDGQDGDISVQAQVKRLIAQATSNENLCQSYIGWCSFW